MTAQNTTKNNTETKHWPFLPHGFVHGPSKLLASWGCRCQWLVLLADPSGGGCWYKAKCEMLLRNIDGEMNVQNCEFSVKLRNGDGATCSTTDCNGSYHGLAPSFFEEMTRCSRQKHCHWRPDNPNGPSKFCKYRVYLPHVRLFTSVRSRLLFHGWW